MASPIKLKHILSPKVLTTFRGSAALKVDPQYTNFTRNTSLARSLNFENPVLKTPRNVTLGSATSLNVPKENNQLLLINTPNKNSLLKDGLTTNQNLHILGQGSFGIVVKGIHKGKEVAVKIAKLSSLSTLREKNALELSHENIVKVLDVILNYNGNYGIVLMEYIKSVRSLLSILDNKEVMLTHDTVINFALNICQGLHYCHSKQILHLDVKPNNILVCDNNTCKLCDFGNSVKVENIEEIYSHQGNVAYTAPEILMGGRPTTKCDVYSLGILLWQMRHRITPYQNMDNAQVIIYKVVKFNLRPSMPNLDLETDKYASIYFKCWSNIPHDRPEVHSVIVQLQSLK